MKILVTGGCGFIGGAFIREALILGNIEVLNIDCLTYASNRLILNEFSKNKKYKFFNVNICDKDPVDRIFREFSPDYVIHFAAESHVDRSIDDPSNFINTNIIGTYNMLQACLASFEKFSDEKKETFKFVHVSTDEVYGDLANTENPFTESSLYSPSSPYAASKASSDHLVRAWGRTYGLPTIVTNCSNNYGPYQFPEKLIPHVIISALANKNIPVYGNGMQIRDWLNVNDHVKALFKVLLNGEVGETYNIGGNNEKTNIQVVELICMNLEHLAPEKKIEINNYKDLISYVEDRPGHDKRYAIDSTKIRSKLNWKPIKSFENGIKETVKWYIENDIWWKKILSNNYKLKRIGKLT